MKELSLHILDIVQNSLAAKATLIMISIVENLQEDRYSIIIDDNGTGMSEEDVKKALNPFYTTRKTRKVGLGLSLLQANAQSCNGDLKINSQVGKGTKVEVFFQLSHIDRAPLGDITSTLLTLLTGFPYIDFVYKHRINEKKVELDTRKIKDILGEIPLDNLEVREWLKDFILDIEKEINE